MGTQLDMMGGLYERDRSLKRVHDELLRLGKLTRWVYFMIDENDPLECDKPIRKNIIAALGQFAKALPIVSTEKGKYDYDKLIGNPTRQAYNEARSTVEIIGSINDMIRRFRVSNLSLDPDLLSENAMHDLRSRVKYIMANFDRIERQLKEHYPKYYEY